MADISDIAKKLAPIAPILGAALGGPAGGAIASGLVKALGLNAPEELADLPPEKLAELDEMAKQIRLAEIKSDTDVKLAQIGVNKTAQKSASIFVSGARPAVIWIGAMSLLYHFLIRPLGNSAFVIHNNGPMMIDGAPFAVFPPIDIAGIVTIMGGLLGFGAKRTIEKWRGVARNSLRD